MKFDIFEVKIKLTEPMLGTVPKNKAVYAAYIASKAPDPQLGEKEVETVPGEIEKSGWTGFHADDDGLFLYDYALLGFLKEAGNVLKAGLKMTNLRSKIDQYVFVFPRRIRLKAEPDGVLERPLRALTMQGPRVTVVRSDYIDAGTEITATIKILENAGTTAASAKRTGGEEGRKIDEAILREFLDYGQLKGLGQFRNGSYGRFEYELKKVGSEDTQKKAKA